MDAAGFQVVGSFNPYWNARGRSYADADGYRVVLQQDAWMPDARRLLSDSTVEVSDTQNSLGIRPDEHR